MSAAVATLGRDGICRRIGRIRRKIRVGGPLAPAWHRALDFYVEWFREVDFWEPSE